MTKGVQLSRSRKMTIYEWCLSCFCLSWLVTGMMADLGECGGYLRVKEASIPPSGVITSPNYPSSYPEFTNCIWLLEVDTDRTIDITIDYVQGETGEVGECIDFLEIRSGSDQSALLVKTCNQTISTTVTSDGTFVWIHFYADSTNHYTGFTLTWKWNDNQGTQVASPLKGCPETMFRCANKECVSWSYVCDGVNDCGCYGPGDEDYGQCFKPEMDKDIKLAIGISVGSGVLITIVVVVGIWERVQQETRRKTNARFERKAIRKDDVNFLQVQLDLRKSQAAGKQSSPSPTPNPTRRGAIVLGNMPIPADWDEGIELDAPLATPSAGNKNTQKTTKTDSQKKGGASAATAQKTNAKSSEAAKVAAAPVKPPAGKLPPMKAKPADKVKIDKPTVTRKMSKPKPKQSDSNSGSKAAAGKRGDVSPRPARTQSSSAEEYKEEEGPV